MSQRHTESLARYSQKQLLEKYQKGVINEKDWVKQQAKIAEWQSTYPKRKVQSRITDHFNKQ